MISSNEYYRTLEAYEQNLFESEIYLKLKEAEYQATSVKKRYTHDEVMVELKNVITGKESRPKNRSYSSDE